MKLIRKNLLPESGSRHTPEMFFGKTVNGFKPSTIFTKSCILDAQEGSEIASESTFSLKV